MALIPLKQTVTVIRQGEVDRWGNPVTPEQRIPLKCRVDESSQKVQNSIGDEVVAGMEITLDKLVDIRYSDQLEYTNELNITIKRTPIKIEIVRALNGKPILTVVYA